MKTGPYIAASEPKCAASARWCALPVSKRQHTSAYVSIRQHTPAYAIHCGKRGKVRSERQMVRFACQQTSPYVRIRQHTSGYVRIRQVGSERQMVRFAWPGSTCGFGVSVTSAPSSCRLPVSIRQHTSAYVPGSTCGFGLSVTSAPSSCQYTGIEPRTVTWLVTPLRVATTCSPIY